MPVNVGTEIDLWVNDYNPAFYVALTDKEDWTYNTYSGNAPALAAWHVYFTNLMTAINVWAAAGGASRTEAYGRDLLNSMYGYIALNTAYGTSFGDIGLMDAHAIYSMSTFVPNTIARSVDWYNDMIVIGGPPPFTSARMVADIAVVTGSPASDEVAKLDAAILAARTVIQGFTTSSLFADFTPTGTPVTKPAQQTYIYTTLNYEAVVTNVTGIQGFALPPFLLP